MTARRPSLHSPVAAGWRQQARTLALPVLTWWKTRTPREQGLLRVAALIILAALLWTQGLRPALHTIEQSRTLLPGLHAQAAQVDALIRESQALRQGQSGSIDPAGLTEALQTSLRRAGLDASAALKEVPPTEGDGSPEWEIALVDAHATRVMEWLASLPGLVHLHTRNVELSRSNIDGRDRPGQVSGRILLQQAARRAP